MGTLVKSTTPISLSDLQAALGGAASPIAITSYYAGGEYVPSIGNSVPTSGAISLNQFLGIETRYTVIGNQTASGSFTVPTGVTRLFVVVVGGGGGGGGNEYTINSDATVTFRSSGGAGGFGGLAMAFQDVTPGAVITVTVGARGTAGAGVNWSGGTTTAGTGTTGGSSVFNGLTATGGAGGTGARSTGSADIPYTFPAGTTGANGTSSGTTYVGTPLLATNVTDAAWTTFYDNLLGRFVGTVNATNRTNITTVRNQTATRVTNTVWAPAGATRPGPGAPTTTATTSAAAGPGAVMIYY
jgi:hypothetical protein